MKVDAFIHAQYDEFEKRYTFKVWSMDMSNSEYGGTLVEKVEIEFAAPPHEVLVKGTIANYREQQRKVRAEAERLNNELQQRINDLLCIEHKPEPTDA